MCRIKAMVSVVPDTLHKKGTGWSAYCINNVQASCKFIYPLTRKHMDACVSASNAVCPIKFTASWKTWCRQKQISNRATYLPACTRTTSRLICLTHRDRGTARMLVITHAHVNTHVHTHAWNIGTATATLNRLPEVPTKFTASSSHFKSPP